MLAEAMAEVKAGKLDPKVANTLAYVGTVLLRTFEADLARNADTPAQPCAAADYLRIIVVLFHHHNHMLAGGHLELDAVD